MELPETSGPLLLDCAPPAVHAGGGRAGGLQTIQYKNRLLYSKYDPTRAVLSLLHKNTPIDPASLVLVCSPCLCYGLDELLAAADKDANIIALEADDALCEIARQRLPLSGGGAKSEGQGQIQLFSATELESLDAKLRQLAATGKYRRVLRLDFSAGTALAPSFYSQVAAAAQDIIAAFWKNQITLVKMGRLFAKNIFQNLPRLATDIQLFQLEKSVGRPILVCGAGESLDCSEAPPKNCFVIAVDAALPPLVARGIRVDAVVGLESQAAIQKAYIGCAASLAGSPPLLFADISSRASVPRSFPNRTVFFASRYAEASYLDRLTQKGIVHGYVIPLGSVGLAAVLIALHLRSDEDVPVFVTGLDFSYSAGRTHALNAPADIQRRSSCNRLSPAENYGAAFSPASLPVQGKEGAALASIQSMIGYARQFSALFAGQRQLFDIGRTGMDLGLVPADNAALRNAAAAWEEKAAQAGKTGSGIAAGKSPPPQMRERIEGFFAEEQQALLALKDLLMHGEESALRNRGLPLDAQIASLLKGREYLHLHFPDGYRVSTDTAFLKRVRAELDFFLKQIGRSRAALNAG